MTATCARCETSTERRIRGLCLPCYGHCQRAGALADYPRVYRTSEEVIGDYAVLRLRGYTQREIAELLIHPGKGDRRLWLTIEVGILDAESGTTP